MSAGVISDVFSDALLQHTALVSKLFPVSPDGTAVLEHRQQQDTHETLMIVPSGVEQPPLDLHIDNCHRRCVALYDTQRILQFGG